MHYSQHIDQAAQDHAQPDGLTRLLHRSRPRFDSAQQFGAFARIVIDEWQYATPGLDSSWGVCAEIERLGTRVQTSPDPSRMPAPQVYHVATVRGVLEQAIAVLSEAYPAERARHLIQVWSQMDILGRTQRQLADHHDVVPSTMHDRVALAREAIYDALVSERMAGARPNRSHQRVKGLKPRF